MAHIFRHAFDADRTSVHEVVDGVGGHAQLLHVTSTGPKRKETRGSQKSGKQPSGPIVSLR